MAAPRNTRKPRIALPERVTPKPIAPIQEPIKAIKNLDEILSRLREMTAKYEGKYDCCTNVDDLYRKIKTANQIGEIAIDTETTGLDVFHDQVVGFSIYTDGIKGTYVPLRHLSRFTGKIDTTQPPVDEVRDVLRELRSDVTLDMANAQFDLLMLNNSLDVNYINYRTNDALLAARILDTERKAGKRSLKDLHADYCEGTTRGPKFGELFPPGTFNLCPYALGSTYAARDAEMTWELQRYLDDWLTKEAPLKKVYEEIEMPLIPVLIRMRQRGILVDQGKRSELTIKYRKLMEESEKKFHELYGPYIPRIRQYQTTPAYSKKGGKIDIPVKIGSDDQIKILFWDIMGMPHNPNDRTVDKNAISATNSEIGNALLEYRMCKKLLSTYLEGLEKHIQADGCVHGSIRQIGADTGRTSANDPNMQNIPSKNREIRQIYRARPGCALISCDYSAQEPRLTAVLANDPGMIKAYQEGRDLYSVIAATAYNTTYEECQEHHPDGSLYLEGKKRRTEAKSIFLGVIYGRSIPSIAEQLHCSAEEAQLIYDKVVKSFPGLQAAQDEAADMAHKYGYVSDLWGRRRHLTVMMHDDYEFEYAPGCNPEFDPFNPESSSNSTEVNQKLKLELLTKLQKMKYWKEKQEFISYLRNEKGIITKDYSKQRRETKRQCLNGRVQSSAASLSKIAMIAIDTDKQLADLGCKLLLMIHDEVICEAPKENLKEVVPRIQYLMEHSAEHLPVPFKTDAEVSENWYGKEIDYNEEGEEI